MAKIVNTSGKRKRAIARATLKEGNGIIRINKSLLTNYGNQLARMRIQEPLEIVNDVAVKVNIDVNVRGGGWQSQAEASRLGIAKALVEFTKSEKLREQYLNYDRTMLVADVRRKEMHKPNRHGKARAKVQKSYR